MPSTEAQRKKAQELGFIKSQSQPQQAPTKPPTTGGSSLPSDDAMSRLATAMQGNVTNPAQQMLSVQKSVPMPERAKTMSYDAAQERAHSQIQPLYQQQLNQDLGRIQQDAIRRGFFGQLPTEGIKARAANESAVGLANSVNMAANDMVNRSEAMAEDAFRYDTQQRNRNVDTMHQLHAQRNQDIQRGFDNIMNIIQYQAGREDAAWNRQQQEFANKLQEASLTGVYNGEPTADMMQFLKSHGLREEQFEWSKYMDQANLSLARSAAAARAAQAKQANDANLQMREDELRALTAQQRREMLLDGLNHVTKNKDIYFEMDPSTGSYTVTPETINNALNTVMPTIFEGVINNMEYSLYQPYIDKAANDANQEANKGQVWQGR